MIRIMCVLRLRVDVIYMNYRATGEYALSVIKILYWCNWNCIEYYNELICLVWWFSKGIICKYLFCSSISFWLVRLFYRFRFITFWFWFLCCNFMVTVLPHSSLIWNIFLFGFSFYKYVFKFGIGIRTWTVTDTVAVCFVFFRFWFKVLRVE